ncbi:MAG: anion permease [Desulfomonilaceae bacterium]|nr:anion permease [Desulfomonilaceae bacterium]
MDEALLHVSVAVALCFAFVNGFHDGGNVVATIIGSRSMHPYRALLFATLAEFIGSVVIGTAVAKTIVDILNPEVVTRLPHRGMSLIVISASAAAILWKVPTWFLGLPSSSSHAIISGLTGAALVAVGRGGVDVSVILRSVVVPLIVSPFLGLLVGYLSFSVIRAMAGQAHRSIGRFFVAVQKPIMMTLAASQGSNDAQKAMGMIALVVLAHNGHGYTIEQLPSWVVVSAAASLAAGVAAGGLRIVKSVGYDLFRMEPVHSCASLLSSTSVVLGASILGGPVSTTQIVGASVVGVGASRRLSSVRWGSARNIGYAWFMTVPVCAALSGLIFWALKAMVSY